MPQPWAALCSGRGERRAVHPASTCHAPSRTGHLPNNLARTRRSFFWVMGPPWRTRSVPRVRGPDEAYI